MYSVESFANTFYRIWIDYLEEPLTTDCQLFITLPEKFTSVLFPEQTRKLFIEYINSHILRDDYIYFLLEEIHIQVYDDTFYPVCYFSIRQENNFLHDLIDSSIDIEEQCEVNDEYTEGESDSESETDE
jgi:hypothetical protein